MAMEPCCEPIKLLIIAEDCKIRDNFIEDLQGFSHYKSYKPSSRPAAEIRIPTTFRTYFREFYIISVLNLNGSDYSEELLYKKNKLQDLFMEPLNMKAIIFLMRPDPKNYQHFLSLNLFNNFINNDIAKIEKIVMFVFVHDNPVSYENSITADTDLWSVLNRIGVDSVHTKTFHFYSRLDKKCYEAFMEFICMNKKTLWVETVYSHESVVKVIENEDFLDLLLEALFLNEDNIHYKATGENKQNYLKKWNDYRTVCTNENCSKFQYCCYCTQVKTKYQLELCDVLKNAKTCTKCNCPISNHKAVKYYINQFSGTQTKEQQVNYQNALITLLVTVDLFQKENNRSVCQLYGRLKERVKQKAHYSILETMYKDAMGCAGIKRITADECIKCIFKMLPHLKGFRTVEYELGQFLSMPERNLMVK